jgi:hypothetical protein
MSYIYLFLSVFVLAVYFATSSAANLTLAAGAFRFHAADFYYPNFYEEAGLAYSF